MTWTGATGRERVANVGNGSSSIDPRVWVAICAVVGLLAAGAGVGGTLLFAERGPQGAQGEQGARGPAGEAGPAGDVETISGTLDDLSGQVSDLDSRVSDMELSGSGVDLTDLDSRVATLEDTVSSLCIELNAVC